MGTPERGKREGRRERGGREKKKERERRRMPMSTTKHHPQPNVRITPEHVLRHTRKQPHELKDTDSFCVPYGHWIKSAVRSRFPLHADGLNQLVRDGLLVPCCTQERRTPHRYTETYFCERDLRVLAFNKYGDEKRTKYVRAMARTKDFWTTEEDDALQSTYAIHQDKKQPWKAIVADASFTIVCPD